MHPSYRTPLTAPYLSVTHQSRSLICPSYISHGLWFVAHTPITASDLSLTHQSQPLICPSHTNHSLWSGPHTLTRPLIYPSHTNHSPWFVPHKPITAPDLPLTHQSRSPTHTFRSLVCGMVLARDYGKNQEQSYPSPTCLSKGRSSSWLPWVIAPIDFYLEITQFPFHHSSLLALLRNPVGRGEVKPKGHCMWNKTKQKPWI